MEAPKRNIEFWIRLLAAILTALATSLGVSAGCRMLLTL